MAISTGSHGGRRGQPFTEINITPLTDIFLVLLIIMMVIAPTFQNSNQEIKMPKIRAGQELGDARAMVEITKTGQLFVDGETASTSDLVSKLKASLQHAKDKMVVVKADQDTQSEKVLQVFDAASEAGFEKLTVAGEPLSDARQGQLINEETQP